MIGFRSFPQPGHGIQLCCIYMWQPMDIQNNLEISMCMLTHQMTYTYIGWFVYSLPLGGIPTALIAATVALQRLRQKLVIFLCYVLILFSSSLSI